VSAVEDAITAHVQDMMGESWPVTAFVVYARVTDPETMTADEPVWIVPDGQRSYITRGLLEEARSSAEEDALPVFVFSDFDDEDDE
jgi:hypothetical protein